MYLSLMLVMVMFLVESDCLLCGEKRCSGMLLYFDQEWNKWLAMASSVRRSR